MTQETKGANSTPEQPIKDTNYSANIQYFETIVKEESIDPQREW